MSDENHLRLHSNEYGVEYVDYFTKPAKNVIDRYVNDYHITTRHASGRPVHPACLNCQILQIDRYKDSQDYVVYKHKIILYSEKDENSVTLGKLRKGQSVSLIERHGEWCHVSTSTLRGECIEHSKSHPVTFSEDKDMLEQSSCSVCDSRLRVISEKKEGWVHWEALTFFKIPCKFIPDKYEIPGQYKATLSPEEQEEALDLIDPLRWTSKWLNMTPRMNQELNLMCTSKNIVLREGRRAGKTWGECQRVLNYCLTTEIYDGKNSDGVDIYRGPEVLVVTPFLSQIELIFGILDKMISRNSNIKIKRRVKTPFHTITFTNGSKIEGFTTGSNSKQEASTVLGQAADLILLDEVDRIDSADITRAIRPIQITSPNVSLMASSTPTGKREWFYNRCMNDPRFKEFFFPSTILPHWEEIKEEAEAEGVHEHFLQEYMAMFTVQVTGVFQPAYVARAEASYMYNQTHPYKDLEDNEVFINRKNQDWIYTIGVDWNTNAGTEIVVGGLDKNTMHYWVVDVINVPKQDWQQTKAIESIIQMNAKWRPKYIYVDRGYGGNQIEILQRIAVETSALNPTDPVCDLVENLHSYDFGSKIEYQDPLDGTIQKTNAKPFLVENSVRRFEEGRIHYPAKDPFITKQLLNYIIGGLSPAGVPRYAMNSETIGDHRIDALMLALIPFKLHLSDFAAEGVPVMSVAMTGFGAGMTRRLVQNGETQFEEFMSDIPRDQHGAPAVAVHATRILHDPGYVAMKEGERYNEKDFSRTSALDRRPNSEAVPEYRYGFSSDTEWKEKKKYPKARVIKRSHSKPRRRSF